MSRTKALTRGAQRIAHDQNALRQVAVFGGLLMVVVSFPQLRWTYEEFVGFATWTAYLVPVGIDGLAIMFAGIIGTLGPTAPWRNRLYAWAGLGFFVAVSIAGNVMHAWWHRTGEYLPPGWEAPALIVFAAIIPAAAALGIHGRSFLDRASVDADQTVRQTPRAPRAAEPTEIPNPPPVLHRPTEGPTEGPGWLQVARDAWDATGGTISGADLHEQLKDRPGALSASQLRRHIQRWRDEQQTRDPQTGAA